MAWHVSTYPAASSASSRPALVAIATVPSRSNARHVEHTPDRHEYGTSLRTRMAASSTASPFVTDTVVARASSTMVALDATLCSSGGSERAPGAAVDVV